MRKVLLALAATLLPSAAGAADYMRGPMYDPPSFEQRFHDWSGTYIGGHGGFTQQNLKPGSAEVVDVRGFNDPVNIPFGGGSGSTGSYGGFIGFNSQWEDIVLGFEMTYSRLGGKGFSSSESYLFSSIIDPDSDPVVRQNVVATAIATQRITDLFGGRFRAGWSTGIFLPYVTAGVVVARGEGSTAIVLTPRLPYFAGGVPSVTSSATPFGFSVGAGVDVAVTSNLFARAEIEYVGLRESKGVGGQFTTYRAGIGYKF